MATRKLLFQPSPRCGTRYRYSLLIHLHSAHAGATPWEGRNALDAAFIAYAALSALRQQLKPTARVHGVIEGRDWAPNSRNGFNARSVC